VRQHDDCSTPALRAQLLARGHAPHRVELVLLGLGSVLLVNLLVFTYLRDYWLWVLFVEALALGGLFVAGDDPMLLARWSWSMRAEDLSDEARLNRRTERGVVHYLGYGFATGMLASLLFI
jgi:hypothetical protein